MRRVQDLPLKSWKMMGGNATFIQLFGTEGTWDCHVIEVPGAGWDDRFLEKLISEIA